MVDELKPERRDCKESATSSSSLVRTMLLSSHCLAGQIGWKIESYVGGHDSSAISERGVAVEGVRQYLKELEADVSVGRVIKPLALALSVGRCTMSLSLICDNGAHAEEIDEDLEVQDETEERVESSEVIDSGDELRDAVERQWEDL